MKMKKSRKKHTAVEEEEKDTMALKFYDNSFSLFGSRPVPRYNYPFLTPLSQNPSGFIRVTLQHLPDVA